MFIVFTERLRFQDKWRISVRGSRRLVEWNVFCECGFMWTRFCGVHFLYITLQNVMKYSIWCKYLNEYNNSNYTLDTQWFLFKFMKYSGLIWLTDELISSAKDQVFKQKRSTVSALPSKESLIGVYTNISYQFLFKFWPCCWLV